MFALINDIESYPAFVPGCTFARVDSRTPTEIVATLGVKKGPMHAEITTRNRLEADQRVTMSLVAGPFGRRFGPATSADPTFLSNKKARRSGAPERRKRSSLTSP